MSIRDLRLTVDIAALQRLPEVSPVASDVALGPAGGRCSVEFTCCCTHFSHHLDEN